jgi:hypothetical protein
MLLVLAAGSYGCYKGSADGRDKEPPPGYKGGFCLAATQTYPEQWCKDGSLCNVGGRYCYDPTDPCEGFFCGGEDIGRCVPDGMGLPACQCTTGYDTSKFPLYCCPMAAGVDARCDAAPASGDALPPYDELESFEPDE